MNVQKILGVIVMLMMAPVAIAVGAIVIFETTGSIDYTNEATRTSMDNAIVNTTFESTVSDNWDNITQDNAGAVWSGESNEVTDNWIGDNCGGSVSTCIFYQSMILPAHNGVTSADVTGAYSISDNSSLDDMNIYVVLERPGGDNIYIILLENTSALLTADNDTWTDIDNDVSSYINAAGTYTLYLQDNSTRSEDVADNYMSVRWDNVTFTTTVYAAGYLENSIEYVESQADTGFSLASLLPLIIAAIALVGIIVAGFVGMKYKGRGF
jgi:hypothetical protein